LMQPERIIAIDWCGALLAAAQRQHIAVAEVSAHAIELRVGRTRDEVLCWLLEAVRTSSASTAIGFDFSFSFPADFFARNGLGNVQDLWRLVAEKGEQWLSESPFPFWGKPGLRRPVEFIGNPPQWRALRRCEQSVEVHGIRPKSIYQTGGAGSVGTGSLRGMAMLATLQGAGFSIWPFDRPAYPLVFEMYPRLLTGAVVKSSQKARVRALDCLDWSGLPALGNDHLRLAENSEDAFDALVSAVELYRARAVFARLRQATNKVELLEGAVLQIADRGFERKESGTGCVDGIVSSDCSR